MRDRLEEIRTAGAELVLVGNGSVKFASAFQHDRAPELRVFTDPSRKTYEALGMKRGVLATIGVRSQVAGWRSTRRGYLQTSLQGDAWQQGGLLAVEKGGHVAYEHANRSAGERPDLGAALAALQTHRSGVR